MHVHTHTLADFSHHGDIQTVDPCGGVVVRDLEVVSLPGSGPRSRPGPGAAVVCVGVGAVTAGASHGLLGPPGGQLTEAPLQTALTLLPAVGAGLQASQACQEHTTRPC